jgi:hypothetical protein
MANQDWPAVGEPGETGPDYVALVIEWDDLEDNVPEVMEEPLTIRPSARKKLAVGAGALGALLLAAWGVRRLRHG